MTPSSSWNKLPIRNTQCLHPHTSSSALLLACGSALTSSLRVSTAAGFAAVACMAAPPAADAASGKQRRPQRVQQVRCLECMSPKPCDFACHLNAPTSATLACTSHLTQHCAAAYTYYGMCHAPAAVHGMQTRQPVASTGWQGRTSYTECILHPPS
jgi:hypothetical protein